MSLKTLAVGAGAPPGTEEVVLLASEQRTGTTYSEDQTNEHHRSMYLFLNITQCESELTLSVEVKDPISGEYAQIWQAYDRDWKSQAYVYCFFPADSTRDINASVMKTEEVCDLFIPRTWRLKVVPYSQTRTVTYSVAALYV